MDKHFDKKMAGAILAKEYALCREDPKMQYQQLSELTKSSDTMKSLNIVETANPRCWRIVTDHDAVDGEEAAFRVQGVIVAKALPPIKHKIRSSSNAVQFLKQGLTIGGLGNEDFAKAIHNATELFAELERAGGRAKVTPSDGLVAEGPEPSMCISNRLFTPRKENPNGIAVVMDSEIDPDGNLQSMAGEEFFYGEENAVDYMERKGGTDKKLTKTSPARFQIGDVVDVQLTINMIPIRQDESKMFIILRGLALLDGTCAKDEGASRSKDRQAVGIEETQNV
ncbi:hypothetical protein HGRIS_011702 [Hohenbuehelia grisea]|uniref:Uncharacterized protein n=1 Tax=Hohenbuehelia grisea TaxID=104357 RepID=A0ABR3JWR3_9AGAR